MQIPLTHPHNHQSANQKEHKSNHSEKQIKQENPQNIKRKEQNTKNHYPSSKNSEESQTANLQYQSEKLKVYFKEIQKKHRNRQAQTMSQLAENSICVGIKTGEVQLADEKHSLDRIMFQSRLKELKKKQEQQIDKKKVIQMQLKYLDEQISSKRRSKSREAQQDNQFIARSDNHTAILSKKQHQQFLQRIIKQRSQISLRKKHLEEKQKARMQQQQRIKRMAEDQLIQKEKQLKKKKIMEKMQQQKVKYQQKIKQQEEYNKRLSQLKQKKFLHQKISEKYATEVLLPSLQDRKKKLRQIREMSKAFNVDQINNFQKEYLKRKQQTLSASQSKKQQLNYKMPEKSQKLAKLLQEESLQTKLKLEQKKRKLQQKIQRQQQFAAYLKQRQPPTIDPKKRQEIQLRIRLKSQEKQKPDSKTLGISYLQQVKQQRKKSANSHLQFQRKQNLLDQGQNNQTKRSMTNYLLPRKTKQQYEQLRQRRIQQIISSDNKNKSQKIMNLQMESNKLIQQQKRKQERNKLINKKKGRAEQDEDTTNLLLASIKAKMGIIDLYNKQ